MTGRESQAVVLQLDGKGGEGLMKDGKVGEGSVWVDDKQ